jgi:hypothetical protein
MLHSLQNIKQQSVHLQGKQSKKHLQLETVVKEIQENEENRSKERRRPTLCLHPAPVLQDLESHR